MIQRIRKGWRTLRENKRAGVSLIVALCAVALIIGLALSLTYSSSLLLARANRKVGRERCYQLAKSFSEVLDGELRRYTTDYTPYANQSGYAPPCARYADAGRRERQRRHFGQLDDRQREHGQRSRGICAALHP